METESVPDFVRSLYSRPSISGARISRMEETFFARFLLTPETAWTLGTNNIGVFVGNSPPLGTIIERLKGLETSTEDAASWVIIAETKDTAADIVHEWFLPEGARHVAISTLELPQSRNNILICTPETIFSIRPSVPSVIAGLILVDDVCRVHKARGFKRGNFLVRNDRPQLVANFRNSAGINGWVPPFFILTQKAAKSVFTEDVKRAYCLDAWWFLEGRYLSFGEGVKSDDSV